MNSEREEGTKGGANNRHCSEIGQTVLGERRFHNAIHPAAKVCYSVAEVFDFGSAILWLRSVTSEVLFCG